MPSLIVRLLAIGLVPAAISAASGDFDVVVYGGTAGGTMAAIAAAQEGLRVALVEPGRHLGGMVSGGLGRTDFDSQERLIGGFALQFFERTGRHYSRPHSWTFEPHVAEDLLRSWVTEAKVVVAYGQRLEAVRKTGAHLLALQTTSGDVFNAKIFIDATYEGDLYAKAGVSYSIGRESRAEFGESLAGRREEAPFGGKQFRFPVKATGDDGKWIAMVNEGDIGNPGDGDKKVQAYNYRLCFTKRPENKVSFERPADYDPKKYEIHRRYLKAADPPLKLGQIFCISPIPNGKYDINDCGPIATNFIGGNWDYPEASHERRQAIWREHLDYIKGLFYFIATDPEVPEPLRLETASYGPAKDEFVDTAHWPHQLYVREARRMQGEYVMTQADLETRRTKYDSIGMGGYNIDSMPVQRIPMLAHHFPQPQYVVVNEGYLTVPVKPYEIPYRSITPRSGECENLLVPVALSATHVAYSSIRMEPQYMILGHSAGIAAAEALRSGTTVQRIDVSKLQKKLLEQKQILSLPE